jgi:hypothetical protein
MYAEFNIAHIIIFSDISLLVLRAIKCHCVLVCVLVWKDFLNFLFISISSGLSIRCVKFVLSVIYLLEFKMVNDLEP